MINALLAGLAAAGWAQTVRVAPIRVEIRPAASFTGAGFAGRAALPSKGIGSAPTVLPGLQSSLWAPAAPGVEAAPDSGPAPDFPTPQSPSTDLTEAARALPVPGEASQADGQAKETASRVFDHRNKGPLPVETAPAVGDTSLVVVMGDTTKVVSPSQAPPQAPPQATDSVLPPYLSVADPADALWVSWVLGEAQKSAAARRVLAKVEAMAAIRGRPVTVVVQRIGNLGTYDFDTEIVTVSQSHRNLPLTEVAPTLVHELLHVVQKSEGVPADALELELEAYLTDFRVMTELGAPIRPRSFEGRGLDQFKKSFPDFVKWLGKQYKDNIPLIGSRLPAYLAKLDKNQKKFTRSLKRQETELHRREEVLRSMESIGHSEEQRRVYETDQIVPLRRNIASTKRSLDWIANDGAMLRTPEGARRYRNFARSVQRKARALRKTLGL